jgi:ribonucleoside-diphosphate reductase alpha chain
MPTVTTCPERDALLTEFGKETLRDRYLLPGETYQGLFARVASTYGDDDGHAQRLYDAMSRLWFMPATPILANGGADRGLPISCYLNEAEDSLEGIVRTWDENVWMASRGGGIGTYWGGLRPVGEKVGKVGETSGIVPFIHVMDGLTLAISQGSLRRGNAAVYVDVWHPEVEEFLALRRPSGDFNRKGLNLHHGLLIPDEFMRAVECDLGYDLRSPRSGVVAKTLRARDLWTRILETRIETGEPYLVFVDRANDARPIHHKELGLRIRTSNLCSETLLPTGRDHLGNERTAVCCMASLNMSTWDEWRGVQRSLTQDVLRMLDNVLTDFIERAPDTMARAKYSAARERAVGLGVMGFHSYLQKNGVPFGSALAKSTNRNFFRRLAVDTEAASQAIGTARGPCHDAAERGLMHRFSYRTAIGPTASISIICGGASACIEPIPANAYVHKTLSGWKVARNPALAALLAAKGEDAPDVWQSIAKAEGSVAHLACLTDDEKEVFRTAFEIDQRWVIEHAADRAPLIDQGQSVNLFLPADADKWDLHMLHWTAWIRGVKSLYYCRSKSLSRAAVAGSLSVPTPTDYEECVACQ